MSSFRKLRHRQKQKSKTVRLDTEEDIKQSKPRRAEKNPSRSQKQNSKARELDTEGDRQKSQFRRAETNQCRRLRLKRGSQKRGVREVKPKPNRKLSLSVKKMFFS